MKLRNIFVICRDNYNAIKQITGQSVTINNRSGIKITGWNKARSALLKLREVASLTAEVDELINSVPDFYRTQNEFNVNNSEWDKIESAKNTLIRTMDDTIDLYDKMGMNTEERIGLDIKLPDFNDFSEFVKYINDIEFVLNKCPFLQNEDEKLVFENVDIGTTWLTFLVIGGAALTGGSILLNNIAAFVDKCVVIRSHFLTTQKQKLELESAKRSESEKKIISGYLDDLYKRQVDIAIKELEDVTNYPVENKDGDEFGRIEQCFNKMGVLLEKGLQIRSSIDSPKEAQALFEPLEMKYLEISDSLKLLEKKEE